MLSLNQPISDDYFLSENHHTGKFLNVSFLIDLESVSSLLHTFFPLILSPLVHTEFLLGMHYFMIPLPN